MRKTVLISMAALFVAALATSAIASGGGRGPGYGPCDRSGRAAAALKLTDEQTAKIKAMREAHWKEMKPLRESMFAKRDELRKLWLAPSPDEARIQAAQKEMRTLRDQMEDRMTAYRLEAVKLLTPEQREKLGSVTGGRGSKRGSGPRHGGPMMGPGPMAGLGPEGPDWTGCIGGGPGFGPNR
jgi:zinc resistance-associated protein